MISFLRSQWFLASISVIFAAGFIFPGFFEPFANARSLRSCIVAGVLFVMALPLDTRSVGQSIRRPWGALYGSIVNMLLLPLAAWGLSRLLSGDMRTGLLVTAAVPSTLASGAVWTRRAGGDDTVAILVTTITNLTCFFVTPFWLFVMTGSEMTDEHLAELARMPIRLGLLVVLPMALAQLLRQRPVIGSWATRSKPLLSMIAQLGILSMVLAGATQCGLKLSETSAESLDGIPAMCVVALVLHVGLLWVGMASAKMLGFGRPQSIAIGISGSQKTLMVGLDIAIHYFGGLAVLPMVTYHFLQLTVDTVIADRLRSGSE